jgi:hypothetical protein
MIDEKGHGKFGSQPIHHGPPGVPAGPDLASAYPVFSPQPIAPAQVEILEHGIDRRVPAS